MDLGLTGKTAIVTGGARGIGASIADRLLKEGAAVLIADRSEPSRQPTNDSAISSVRGDLSETETCRRAVQEAVRLFGSVDILINNAGINDGVGLDAGPTAFKESLQKNLIHYYTMAHLCADHLKASRGCIVNIGSKVSISGQGGTSGYAAAKGAVNALTREWAVELAPFDVRVNAVLPAETWTPLYEDCLASMTDPSGARRAVEALIPLGHRFTAPEEIADTAVFLASARSSHTTGQVVFVDGGYTHLDRKCTAGSDVRDFGKSVRDNA